MEKILETVSLSADLDLAPEVLDPSGDAVFSCLPVNKWTKTDALDNSTDDYHAATAHLVSTKPY
jgi:hypothetical protein